MPMSSSKCLSSYLLSLHRSLFTLATQSSFLAHAASGHLPKSTISHWLANDRLYMRGYIRLAGELLRILPLPDKPTPPDTQDAVQIRFLDWLVDALVNIRREERFFIDVAHRYGLDLDLTGGAEDAQKERKTVGLERFEKLFGSLTTGTEPSSFLPWLEGAVVFWGTEKVYFEAWSWAKRQALSSARNGEQGHAEDLDGGAMRKEFIPNWTNDEFIDFVDALENILNEGVEQAAGGDEEKWKEIKERAEHVWKRLLESEEAFWPQVDC